MSNEHSPITSANILYTHDEFERKCEALASVDNDVRAIIQSLKKDALRLEGSDELTHAHMLNILERFQLEKLMNIVFATVELQRYDNLICLDDPELLTINEVRESYENATGGIDPGASLYTRDVLRISEKRAVDHLTTCLAPDKAYGDVTFLPWHRKVFGKIDNEEEFTVPFETIIPKFVVDFYYKPGDNFPERLAHLVP